MEEGGGREINRLSMFSALSFHLEMADWFPPPLRLEVCGGGKEYSYT